MSDTKLLPCPFCGGDPHLMHCGAGTYMVQCLDCKVTSDDGGKDRITEKWNRRPPLLEVAKGALRAWDGLYHLFPVCSEIEDAEFEEFLKLRSEINKAEGRMPWEAGDVSKTGA